MTKDSLRPLSVRQKLGRCLVAAAITVGLSASCQHSPGGTTVQTPPPCASDGCGPDAPPSPAPKLVLCDEKLRQAPPLFKQPALAGLSAPALDQNTVAAVECMAATAAAELGEIEARKQRAIHGSGADLAALVQGLGDVSNAHAEQDAAFERLYASRAESSTRGVDLRPLFAVALLDYSRLVQSAVGTRLHTRVEALRDSAFCAGDIIESRLLWRYFEAALGSRAGAPESVPDVARTLRSIAIQTACLGDQQLFELDTALSTAWDTLETRLGKPERRALLDGIEPFVFQLRLVVLDATKEFGTLAPGYRWLVEREDLRRRLRDQAIWPLENAVWLYDRRSAGLAAVKTQCKDGGTGARCLNLAVFTDSLLQPAAYGLGECSFLEMIEGGVRNLGGAPAYTCTGGACGTPTKNGRIPKTALGKSFNTTSYAGYQLPPRQVRTPFGVELDTARGLLCGDKSGGGFGGKDGAAGMSAGGMGTGSSLIACVLAERAERTGALVPGSACIARYVQATSQLASAFESMAATAYAGVPQGCAVSDAAKTEEQKKADDKKKEDDKKAAEEAAKKNKDKENQKELDKQVKDAAKKLAEEIRNDPAKRQALKDAAKKQRIDLTDEDIDNALTQLENASAGNIPLSDGKLVAGTTDLNGKIEIDMVAWLVAGAGQREQTLLHEFVHSATSSYWKSEWEKRVQNQPGGDSGFFKQEREVRDTEIYGSFGGGKQKQCVRDSSTCNDRCNGMSRQLTEALACLDKAFNPEVSPPRPIDLVKDPIEPSSARGESLMKCVADGSDLAGVVAAKQCGAVRCANTSAGLTSGGCCLAGGSLAGTDMGSRHQSICQVAHCQASVSETGASSGGNPLTACGCSGSYTTPGVPPGGPSGGYLPPVESPFPPAGVPPH